MNKITDTYQNIANTQSTITERARRIIMDYAPFLIVLLTVAFTVASRLFNAWIENPFTTSFFVSLATNLLSTMLCYTIMIPVGEESERLATPAYASNRALWAKLSGDIRTGMNDAFVTYCRTAVEEERDERRCEIVQNHTMISRKTYKEKYCGLSKSKLDELVKLGELSSGDAFWLSRANGRIRIKAINPLIILSGVRATHINDAGRSGSGYAVTQVISRPLLMLIMSAFVSMLKGSFIGIADASALYDMIWSAISIVISSMSGFYTGTKSAKREHERIKSRIFFIEKFLEKHKNANES